MCIVADSIVIFFFPYNLLTTYLDTEDLTVEYEKNISQIRAKLNIKTVLSIC